MTGYTVHTGSTKKFANSWDRIFGKPSKKSGGSAKKKSKSSKSSRGKSKKSS